MSSIINRAARSASLVAAILALAACSGPSFNRQDLDSYVASQPLPTPLDDGTAVYVDFSDGMQFAYASPQAQALLRSVVNKLSGAAGIADFYSLADAQISPLQLSQTEIYNTIVSPASYSHDKAPIEATLKQILQKRQPALLITDFEEYNGNLIQQQNYAKDYFILWLTQGYNIVFYKLDFVEKGKDKHLYFTVFDDGANRLLSRVSQAVAQVDGSGVQQFVLGSPEYTHPMGTAYLSTRQGGNYHDATGEDLVSCVLEDGSDQAYVSYSGSLASASEQKSLRHYSKLDEYYGRKAEYYPLMVSWPEVLENAKALTEEGVPSQDLYLHFLAKLYVNFTEQDGFDIQGIEARVFDMEPVLAAYVAANAPAPQDEEPTPEASPKAPSPADSAAISLPEPAEIYEMFNASLLPAPEVGDGWQEIVVDFDPRFSGAFPAGATLPSDLFKINIVISQASPRLDRIEDFFAWPGNRSLAESVINTLQSPYVNPKGRVLFSYYVKALQ